MDKNQNKNRDQAKVDLLDIKEHVQMVTNINYALQRINKALLEENLANPEKQKNLESYFSYLETHEPAAQYLQTFAPFYRLYNYLKEVYKTEVLHLEQAENEQ
jgi:hypothetical protein